MKLLDSFTIKEKINKQHHPCQLQLLNECHYLQVVALQDFVINNLKDKGLFFPLSQAEVKNILTPQGGLGIGAFVQDELVGFRSIYFPGHREDNLGIDIGLSGSELLKVVHLEASFVHPSYQGNSLQKRMTTLIINRVLQLNQFKYLLSTVTPTNIASILDKFAQKMTIVDLKEKYNSGLRYIFVKDLQSEQSRDESQAVSVSIDDITSQLALLKKGCQGINYEKSPNSFNILFSPTNKS